MLEAVLEVVMVVNLALDLPEAVAVEQLIRMVQTDLAVEPVEINKMVLHKLEGLEELF